MVNSKTYLLINSLSPSESNQVRSEIKRKRGQMKTDLQTLLEILQRNQFPKTKEKLWEEIFPQLPFQDGYLRKLMYELTHIISDQMVTLKFARAPFKRDLLLLTDFRERGLKKPFLTLSNRVRKQLESQDTRSLAYHSHKRELVLEEMKFRNQFEPRRKKTEFQPLLALVEKEFILNWLRLGCLKLNHDKVLGTDGQKEPKKNPTWLVPLIESYGSEEMNPEISVYWKVYRGLSGDHNISLDNAKEAFFQWKHLFSQDEQGDLFGLLHNWLIRKINHGEEESTPIAYQLYEFGIRERILTDGSNLNPAIFKNLVGLGLKLGKVETVKKQIGEYGPMLPEPSRMAYIQFANAHLAFKKGELSKVYQYLNQVEESDVFLSVSCRMLKLKTAILKSDWEYSEALIQSFTMYLRRNKSLSGLHAKSLLDKLYFFRKLVNADNQKQLQKLKAEILQTNRIIDDKTFLQQQIENLLTQGLA